MWGRRFSRWLRRRLRPPDLWFVHHPDYVLGVAGIPLDPQRADRILAYLLDGGLAQMEDVSRPLPASLENIARVHARAYLEALDAPETLERVLGFPVSDEQQQRLLDYQRLHTGGTIQATRLALRTGRTAVHLGGGFHHAAPDRGLGFSIFNDVAVAVVRLRAKGFTAPVLIVDLDLHDGNGTRRAFAHDESVHTFSIHNETWNDDRAVADTCIALGSGVSDEDYLQTLTRELPPVVRAHRPLLVIYVAGVDGATDDVLGNWNLSAQGILARDRLVVETVRATTPATRLVVVLAGGYGRKAWQYSARFFGWLLSGRELDPVEDIDAVVRRFRRVMREFLPTAPEAERGKPDWTLSPEDLDLGLVGMRETRLLGQLSKHVIELTLERLGLLHQLRSIGFVAPMVAVDAASPLGHTVRVFGDPERKELLVELRVSVKRDAVPGLETLYVEWLLLQNPRVTFANEQRRLPGQAHPGLGLLREVVGWLIVLCESLGFDGIAFTPAHFYMAALGRRHLEFVRPEDAAMFAAVGDTVAALDLAEASRVIDQGQVVDEATGTVFRWPAPLMVLPISDRLRARVSGESYDAVRRHARAALRFRLDPSGVPEGD